jgi:hypothetical protein
MVGLLKTVQELIIGNCDGGRGSVLQVIVVVEENNTNETWEVLKTAFTSVDWTSSIPFIVRNIYSMKTISF